MNRAFATLAALAALTTTATAADVMMVNAPMAAAPMAMAAAPASSWTGFYAGVFGGIGFDPSTPGVIEIDEDLDGNFDEPLVGPLAAAFGDNFSGENRTGGFVGLEAGYDLQIENFVVGGTIDIAYLDYAERQSGFSATPAFYNQEAELEFLATIGARAGILVTDDVLAYVHGGLAYGEVNYSFDSNNPNGTSRGGPDGDFGYQVGAGVETRVTEHLSLGFEYAYTNLGESDFTTRFDNGPFAAVDADGADLRGSNTVFDFHTVAATLRYRF